MADEEIKTDEEVTDVEDIQDVEETTNTEEVSTEGLPQKDDRENVIKWIGNKVKLAFGDKEEKDIETKETEEASGEEISGEFIKAAREAGWEDDDIVAFAGNYDNDELNSLIPAVLDTKDEEESEEGLEEDEVTEGVSEEDESSKLVAKLNETEEGKALLDNVLKPLLDKTQTLENTIKELQTKVTESEETQLLNGWKENASFANDEFDKLSDSFGKTEELPTFPNGKLVPTSPQYQARQGVWSKAGDFHSKLGIPFKDAFKDALQWYKGGNMEKDVERKVLKRLRSNEDKVMPEKKRKHIEKQYENSADEKADIVRQVAQQAGVDL